MLIYIGKGAVLIGVPERDLTDEDIKELGLDEAELVVSGLYEKPAKTKQEKPKQEIVTND